MKSQHLYILCGAVCVLIVLFASRLTTLEFGKVLPDRSAEDQKLITSLEQKVETLQAQVHTLEKEALARSDYEEKLAELENLQSRHTDVLIEKLELQEQLENARKAPITRVIQSPSNPATRPAVDQSPGSDDGEETVRRGDSMEKVRRIFGAPTSVDPDWPGGERWTYSKPGYAYVLFKDGKVFEWHGLSIEP